MRRHYIVEQLQLQLQLHCCTIAHLCSRCWACPWDDCCCLGGVGNHDKYQGYKYEKYSREIIFRWESCLLSIDCWSVFCLAARQIESDNQIWYKIHHCFKRRVSQNENFNISNLAVLVSTCSSRPPDFALYAATFSFSSAFMGPPVPVTAPLRFDISQLLG